MSKRARLSDKQQFVTINFTQLIEKFNPEKKAIDLHNLIEDEVLKHTEKGHQIFKEMQLINIEYKKRYGEFQDMFGEYITAKGMLDEGKGQVLTPYVIVDYMCKSTLEYAYKVTPLQEVPDAEKDEWHKRKDTSEALKILDPACGTGRFMLGIAKWYHENLRMYNFIMWNIDIDIRMVNMCLLNAVLYNIPAFVVHGNALIPDEIWKVWVSIPNNFGDHAFFASGSVETAKQQFREAVAKSDPRDDKYADGMFQVRKDVKDDRKS